MIIKENILGKKELESVKLKLNWEFAVPGLATTRCCATGTCENSPIPCDNQPDNFALLSFLPDTKSVKDITLRYGFLRL